MAGGEGGYGGGISVSPSAGVTFQTGKVTKTVFAANQPWVPAEF